MYGLFLWGGGVISCDVVSALNMLNSVTDPVIKSLLISDVGTRGRGGDKGGWWGIGVWGQLGFSRNELLRVNCFVSQWVPSFITFPASL